MPNNYQTIKLSPHFRLEVTPFPRGFTLSDYDKTRIEQLWHEEVETHSKIFNGQMLNFVSQSGDTLVGEFIDYKFYLAQLRDEALEPFLQIRPICISGLTLAGDKVLLGRRSEQVTQYQNFYETVPSGSIDPSALNGNQIVLERQFERELWEETGISVTEIKRIRPFALIYDPETLTYEICGEIEVNYGIVHEKLAATEEYDAFVWLPKSQIKAFIAKHAEEIVPFSLFLIKGIR